MSPMLQYQQGKDFEALGTYLLEASAVHAGVTGIKKACSTEKQVSD
jgi:hypothetical protein